MKSLVNLLLSPLLLCSLLACETSLPADAPLPNDALPALEAVHAAFLAADVPTLVSRVHALLQTPNLADDTARNALAVLERAQDDARGHLPADWRVPAPLTSVRIKLLRIEAPDGVVFQLLIGGNAPQADTLRQVSLLDTRGRALLDRRAGLGVWSSEPEEGGVYWELEGPELSTPPAEGYATVHFELADGSVADGWFPMTRMRASAAPSLQSPAPDQAVDTPNPELVWTPFRSPEYRPFERRSTGLWVTRVDPASSLGLSRAWSLWTADGDLTRAMIGRDARGTPATELDSGAYWCSVTGAEQWWFGDLQLIRAGRTTRPFTVQLAVPALR